MNQDCTRLESAETHGCIVMASVNIAISETIQRQIQHHMIYRSFGMEHLAQQDGFVLYADGQMLHGSRTVIALLQKQALRILAVFTNGSMLVQIRQGSLYNAKNAGRQKEIPFLLIEMFRYY